MHVIHIKFKYHIIIFAVVILSCFIAISQFINAKADTFDTAWSGRARVGSIVIGGSTWNYNEAGTMNVTSNYMDLYGASHIEFLAKGSWGNANTAGYSFYLYGPDGCIKSFPAAPNGIEWLSIKFDLSGNIPSEHGNYYIQITAPGDNVSWHCYLTDIRVTTVEQYTLSYNSNGGSDAPSSTTHVKDSTITIPGDKPIRAGYDFLGWSASADSTTAEFVGGDTLTITKDTTLYAVWARKTESLNEWQLHSVPQYDIDADGDYIYYNYDSGGYVDPVYHGWTASYWYYKTENFNPKRVEKFKISTSWSSNNGSGSAGGYSYYIIYDADTGNALTSTSSLGTILYENTWTAMPEFDDSVTNVYVRVVTGCSYAAWDGVYASKTLADFRVRGYRTPYIMSDTPATKTYNYQDSLSLSISATGADPLSYQWYENDTAIAGATSPTLNLGVQEGLRYNGSKIYCKTTNEFGATTSQTCTLSANVGTFKPLFSASSLTSLNYKNSLQNAFVGS